MKKVWVTASKKTKIIAQTKIAAIIGKKLPIFSAVPNMDVENPNLSIITNIKDLLTPPIQQIREIRGFLILRTNCMDSKPNLNNDLSDIICDKVSVVENKILKVKLEEANKENTFIKGEVKGLTVYKMQRFKPLPIILKHIRKSACYKKPFIHKYNRNLAFKLILPKVISYTIKITFQIKAMLSFCKLTLI